MNPRDLPDPFTPDTASLQRWMQQLQGQLHHNVLPYWRQHMQDPAGGFYGGRTNEGRLRNDLPRTSVLCSRIAWSFAQMAMHYGSIQDKQLAHHAWYWLRDKLWDKEFGGVYWSTDAIGLPLQAHKQTYAQAFAIYGMAAYHRLSEDPLALERALHLLQLLDLHAHDPVHSGYFEGCARDWTLLDDARLSPKEPACDKSMNTLLHVMEALVELLRCPRLPAAAQAHIRLRVRELVELFLDRIWLSEHRHFGLFFSADWQLLSERISYGHDIETAWLLQEAAEQLDDTPLLQRCQQLAVTTAYAVLERGTAPDGSLYAEGHRQAPDDLYRHWWAQAEAVVGFWNAYTLCGDAILARAAWSAWQYIETHHVDRVHGEWFKVLDANGQPLPEQVKTGPWECPYHHVRACEQMLQRLANPPTSP